MRRDLPLLVLVSLSWAAPALPFCGFYVGKADTRLFNQASQVALVRDGERTTMTMANDFSGDLTEFAVVIPVPTVLRREQIEVVDKALLDHLDAFSAPRLVEYFDEDPCLPQMAPMVLYERAASPAAGARAQPSRGVTIEAQYTIGEYDILILSAKESDGLELWLRENGYKIPEGASRVLGSYIKQQMRFFVARVNLKEQAKLGYTYLRPLRVSYESPKFMLPVRLGTVNAKGTQELFVFAIAPQGRVETTNYRTVRLPSGMDLPVFVKQEFPRFYKAMFADQVRREDMRTVFVEYAWDMAWCDPCAADPLSQDELVKLGVSWLSAPQAVSPPGAAAAPPRIARRIPEGGAPFITRLHVRYDAAHFPEDLVFQETADRENFQGRYVLRHPWTGTGECSAATAYRTALASRREKEAQNLAGLTGWAIGDIRRKMGGPQKVSDAGATEGQSLWGWLRGR
jgi:hypothetical protein